ncbi:MAG: 16S rRNA (cytosine(967)-C(5))-methyltransferase RsmB [Clostridia bacterium]|nr:16S rRNA (cytosine(967)-C(5))-methyltransferase RsmB [Clostridia bacterium]
MMNARKIAVKALSDIYKSGAYSNITLKNIFSQIQLSTTDKSFISALFYGVLDRKITIDCVLKKFLRKPVEKLGVITYAALQIAIYQIMFMDKTPDSAAVNESVNIVKNSREKYNSSLVNAILRSYLREGFVIPSENDINSLSIRFSCPEWIIDSFISDYGIDDTVKFLENSLIKPPITLRVNTQRTTAEELLQKLKCENINTEIVAENALSVIGSIDIENSPSFKKGYFHVQDMASQKSLSVLTPAANERILDLCASPGGKTFTMAQMMQNKGEIFAFDLYPHRVQMIHSGAKRLGLDIVKSYIGDATVFNDKIGKFNAVLCDVPCSGLGVIRRKPEIKYKENAVDNTIADIQLKILDNATNYLEDNGRILYSTCTLRKIENELLIKAFLDKHHEYEVKYQHTYMPHIDGTDGFYCALLTKSR